MRSAEFRSASISGVIERLVASSGRVGRYENLAIGLAVARERLYARIDRRFDAMVAAGLIEEVRGLLAAGYGAASCYAADHRLSRDRAVSIR